MPSSAFRHIFYRPELEELSVWFRETGRRYKYFGVPQFIYEELLDAPSRGRYYNDSIRGQFECRLIEEPGKRRRA